MSVLVASDGGGGNDSGSGRGDSGSSDSGGGGSGGSGGVGVGELRTTQALVLNPPLSHAPAAPSVAALCLLRRAQEQFGSATAAVPARCAPARQWMSTGRPAPSFRHAHYPTVKRKMSKETGSGFWTQHTIIGRGRHLARDEREERREVREHGRVVAARRGGAERATPDADRELEVRERRVALEVAAAVRVLAEHDPEDAEPRERGAVSRELGVPDVQVRVRLGMAPDRVARRVAADATQKNAEQVCVSLRNERVSGPQSTAEKPEVENERAFRNEWRMERSALSHRSGAVAS